MALIVASIFGLGLTTALVVGDAFLLSLPVMWLWNLVIPDVFGLKALTWAHALWLTMLCGLLLGRRASAQAK